MRTDQPIGIAVGQLKSLQGHHRAATEWSDEGKLVSQIPMALQVAPVFVGMQDVGDPPQNRAEFLGHFALPLRPIQAIA